MSSKIGRFTVPIKKPKDSSNVTCIILASMSLQGMKSMPSISLMSINKQQNILDVQIESVIATFPKAEIILVVGHDSNDVLNHKPKFVRAVENLLFDERGEGEEIRLSLNNTTTDSVLLIGGNCVFNSDAIQQLKGHGSCTLIDGKGQIDKDSLGVIHNNNRVENIVYGVSDKWCYITYLEGRELSLLRKFVSMRNRSNMCMFEAINYIINNGGVIYTVKQNNGFLRRICSSKDVA